MITDAQIQEWADLIEYPHAGGTSSVDIQSFKATYDEAEIVQSVTTNFDNDFTIRELNESDVITTPTGRILTYDQAVAVFTEDFGYVSGPIIIRTVGGIVDFVFVKDPATGGSLTAGRVGSLTTESRARWIKKRIEMAVFALLVAYIGGA